MIPGAAGRRVAVVGRAETLLGSMMGEAIDALDLVVRVNWTLPVAEEMAASVGRRTDVLYHCLKLCEGPRQAAAARGVPTARLDQRLRQEMSSIAGSHPIHYQPNTGTVAVMDALRSGATEVHVFGMDLFGSGHIGDPMPLPKEKTWTWDHDPALDAEILRGLVRGGRVIPDPTLRACLGRMPS